MKTKIYSIIKLVTRVAVISLLPASLMWVHILHHGDSSPEAWEMWDATFYAIENFGQVRVITVVVSIALFVGLVVTLATWRAYYVVIELSGCLRRAYRRILKHLREIITNGGAAK